VSIIIRITIEDDETFFAPKKNQVLAILIFPCSSAKETAGLPLAEDELFTPGCPEPFQVKLLFFKFLSHLFPIYNENFYFQDFCSII
jgi:hypothetical protein